MKIWIVHDSHFGNGEQLAKTLGSALEKNREVNIDHIKNVSPEKVVSDAPVAIIIGTAARKFMISGASKKWLRKLKTTLKKEDKTIKYGATFLTHVLDKKIAKIWGERFHKKLRNLPIDSVYPEWISGRVQTTEGPFMIGEQEKFEKIGQALNDWMK